MKRLLPLFLLSPLAACGDSAPAGSEASHGATLSSARSSVEIPEAMLAAFAPLPGHYHGEVLPSEARIDLGRMLYFDPRLSADGTVSCNSCHDLAAYGVDGEPTSPGVGGSRGDRNSPTVYMAAGHISQFWDGREPHVEAQAKGPILNPIEMAMPSAHEVIDRLSSIEGYVAAFAAAFPGEEQPIHYDNLAEAIGAFERGLVTPAPWDAFLAGRDEALTEQQKRGFLRFQEYGCQTCHNGPLFGGGMSQKLGLVRRWPDNEDMGIGALTGDPAQNEFFKVPSLRNITRTGPYLHDGSIRELQEVVRMMANYQLDREIPDPELEDLVAFLGALEGRIDPEYTAKPALP